MCKFIKVDVDYVEAFTDEGYKIIEKVSCLNKDINNGKEILCPFAAEKNFLSCSEYEAGA
jgi:hypothetical protein